MRCLIIFMGLIFIPHLMGHFEIPMPEINNWYWFAIIVWTVIACVQDIEDMGGKSESK